MTEPQHIELSQEEVHGLMDRIKASNLSLEDQELVLQLFQFNTWLQSMLQEAKISMSRLRQLFGFFPKKKKKSSPEPSESSSPTLDNPASGQEKPRRKGHGRRGAASYSGADEVHLSHPRLNVHDPCPLDCEGRLVESRPGIVIRVSGSPLLSATRYVQEKLRCALCGALFTAPLPEDCSTEQKYDEKAKALLAHYKYWLGLPFHRIESFQELVGIPLPRGTQFELVEQVADCLYPIYRYLLELAAQGKVIYNDDTTVRILSLMAENAMNAEIQRKGIYTSGIISEGAHPIVLFFSGRCHAGENLDQVLSHRKSEEPIIHMADALSASQPKDAATISCLCLAHARRKFEEIEDYWPEECAYVLEVFSQIYRTDRLAHQADLSPEERLKRHQFFSVPHLDALKKWLDFQKEHLVDGENSSLGEALAYLDRHWWGLTQFTRVAGAPFDNNIVERSLKIPIRNRKNALFYKTEHGAQIGDILMSAIATAHLSEVNPLDYLIALQKNRSSVLNSPQSWLPWNYHEALAPSSPRNEGLCQQSGV